MTDIIADKPIGAARLSDSNFGQVPFDVEIYSDWSAAATRWDLLVRRGSALPFQRSSWIDTWYRTLGAAPEIDPLVVFVKDRSLGADVLCLSLIRRRQGSLRSIEFADLGITDYNAPVVAADVAQEEAGARHLWSALRNGLKNADLIQLSKMPVSIGGILNPLALLPEARAANLNGNILSVEGPWDEWHWGLERTFRKELERSWRVFCRHSGAAFRRFGPGPEAIHIFTELKQQQSARIRELGLPYLLDEPRTIDFYDTLVAEGLRDGTAILTALVAENEIVAALLGITDGSHYAMVRLSTAGGEWKNCSPGRLIIERTMRALHEDGYRTFDFTIGDYPYKRRMGVVPVPLKELTAPLSWRGLPFVAVTRAKHWIKEHPKLVEQIRKLKQIRPAGK